MDGHRERGLHSGFLTAADRHPDRPALEVGGLTFAYRELRDRAASLAATLQKHSPGQGSRLTGVLAHRSPTAFAGLLGALFRGHGYVPLHPRFPEARTQAMLERSQASEVIAEVANVGQLDSLLADAPQRYLVVLADCPDASEWQHRWPQHVVLGQPDLEQADAWQPVACEPSAIAYLLFTSGSTGTPKGVMVAHRNITHFVDGAVERYEISERDRFSQTFDLTFDLSVFDMFVAWERGACVCCPSSKALLAPAQYVRDARLSLWFSVPSLALLMARLGMLEPDSYPDLRWSLFCGEPLPVAASETWNRAAPNSTVENLYGPTEVTIACTAYRWDPALTPQEAELGVVPIGDPLPGMDALVVADDLHEVAPGQPGELLMAGPQVTPGYWQDRERTAASFVVPPGRQAIHYRTGDRVRRPPPGEPLRYLGRWDDQVKVQGHRVELGEIEAAIRDVSGVGDVAAVGWPPTPSGYGGVVAFLGAPEADVARVRALLAQRLPSYMVPRQLRLLPELPLNANGKRDRQALLRMLDGVA